MAEDRADVLENVYEMGMFVVGVVFGVDAIHAVRIFLPLFDGGVE